MKKFFLLFIFLSWTLFSQVETSISQQSSYVGDTFYLTYKVEAEKKGFRISQIDGIEGLDIVYEGENLSTSSYTQIVNGKIDSKKSFNYAARFRITALKSGTWTIPSVKIYFDDKYETTKPVTIYVENLKKLEDYQLEINFPYTDLYVNQPVKGLVKLTIKGEIEGLDMRVPFFSEVGIIPIKNSSQNVIGNLQIGDFIFPVSRDIINRAGEDFYIFSFEFILTPKTKKDIDLSSASATFNAVVGVKNYVDSFGFPYTKKEKKKISIPADKKILSVGEVPKPHPENWTGIIGKPILKLICDSTVANVGDPITFYLEVDGIADKSIDIYPINKIDEWNKNFKIPEKHSPATFENGIKKYIFTVRALNERVDKLPEYKLTYFDVDKKTFAIAKSNAVDLKINPANIVSAESIEEFDSDKIATKKINLKDVAGIFENITGQSVLANNLNLNFTINLILLLIAGVFVLGVAIISIFYFLKKADILKKSEEKKYNKIVVSIKKILSNINENDLNEKLLEIYKIIKNDLSNLKNYSSVEIRLKTLLDKYLYSGLKYSVNDIIFAISEELKNEKV